LQSARQSDQFESLFQFPWHWLYPMSLTPLRLLWQLLHPGTDTASVQDLLPLMDEVGIHGESRWLDLCSSYEALVFTLNPHGTMLILGLSPFRKIVSSLVTRDPLTSETEADRPVPETLLWTLIMTVTDVFSPLPLQDRSSA